MPAVIDASVAAKWLLYDERSKGAEAALRTISEEGAIVPAIFPFEIENILITAERRKRIGVSEVLIAIALLKTLDIIVDAYAPSDLGRHTDIARRYALTSYDAAYVVLALQVRGALYTADARLAGAARSEQLTTFMVR